MTALVDAAAVAVDERRLNLAARARVTRDLDADISETHTHAGNDLVPIKSVNRDVLAGGAGRNWMPLGAKRIDQIHGVEAERPIGPSVVLQIARRVADNAERPHVGLVDGMFRHATMRDVD
jgi:hypothetical protein